MIQARIYDHLAPIALSDTCTASMHQSQLQSKTTQRLVFISPYNMYLILMGCSIILLKLLLKWYNIQTRIRKWQEPAATEKSREVSLLGVSTYAQYSVLPLELVRNNGIWGVLSMGDKSCKSFRGTLFMMCLVVRFCGHIYIVQWSIDC